MLKRGKSEAPASTAKPQAGVIHFFDGKYFYCHDSAHGRRTSFYTWDQMADVVANKRSGLFEIGF